MYQHIKLTEEQAKQVHGKELSGGWAFLVRKDINEEYFLDPYQVENCTNPEFQWLKEMPLSEYVPYDHEAQLQGSGSVNF
jgi:hypothetical protein